MRGLWFKDRVMPGRLIVTGEDATRMIALRAETW